jgi:hypothetical protein
MQDSINIFIVDGNNKNIDTVSVTWNPVIRLWLWEEPDLLSSNVKKPGSGKQMSSSTPQNGQIRSCRPKYLRVRQI